MTRDVRFTSNSEGEGEGDQQPWINKISTAGKTPFKAWSRNINDSEAHKVFSDASRIEGKLPVGAYLLEAKGGGIAVRDVLLVSDATLVLKTTGTQALVFFAHALTGAPIPNAAVAFWESYVQKGKLYWRIMRQTTDGDGLARFVLKGTEYQRILFAGAADNDRQAFSTWLRAHRW